MTEETIGTANVLEEMEAPEGTPAFKEIFTYEEYFAKVGISQEEAERTAQSIGAWGLHGKLTHSRPSTWAVGDIWYFRADQLMTKGPIKDLLKATSVRLRADNVSMKQCKEFDVMATNAKSINNVFFFGYLAQHPDEDEETVWVAGSVIYKEPKNRMIGSEYLDMSMSDYIHQFIDTGGSIAVLGLPNEGQNLLSIALAFLNENYHAEQQDENENADTKTEDAT